MAIPLQQTASWIEEEDLTSSKTGTLYFAYGSNLSPSQMRLRCSNNPGQSAKPVAITRLERWSWLICERGYANVKEISQNAVERNTSPVENISPKDCVYGVVYDMDPDDVTDLDGFEGCGPGKDPHPERNNDPDPAKRRRMPHLQGLRDYNKHYLPVTVDKWLVDPGTLGITDVAVGGAIDVLVYVDERHLEEGEIIASYVGRMNRAIRESAELGMPVKWMDDVMRKWVTRGVELKDSTFIGNNSGYRKSWAKEEAGMVNETL